MHNGQVTSRNRNEPRQALWALGLLVPVPTLGTLAAMEWFPGTALGQTVFMAGKIWLFAFPVIWLKLIERGRLGVSPVRNGGWWLGLATGIVLSLAILAAYAAFGDRLIDRELFATKIRDVGLDAWPAYLAGAAYWTLINSVLEEYVWRWFVYRQCEKLATPKVVVPLSALFFTLHHFFALRAYGSLPFALIGSLGIFAGGTVWSLMFRRYRSIWPGYLSHAIVDLTVFGIGAAILFG